MATQQAAPDAPHCGFCNKLGPDLARFHSTELLDIAREYNPNFTRRSLFCPDCVASTERKFRQRKLYDRLKAKKARSGIDQSTRSYSDVPSSLSNVTSSSSESNRTRHQTGGNRKVAKRTGGPPRNPIDPPATGMEIIIPTASEEGSGQTRQSSSASSNHDLRQTTQSPATGMEMNVSAASEADSEQPQQLSSASNDLHQTTQSHTSNIDVGNDDDDDDYNGNDNNASNSVSSQAPMPSNRPLRSQTTSQPLTPDIMSDMTSAERAEFMRNYKRGGGG